MEYSLANLFKATISTKKPYKFTASMAAISDSFSSKILAWLGEIKRECSSISQ
jgi:hypothetical protein